LVSITFSTGGAVNQALLVSEYAHLTLSELRSCRRALKGEEHKVSYWRRLIQARADVTQAGEALTAGDPEALHRVLCGKDGRPTRTALLHVSYRDVRAPLAEIAALWTRLVSPSDSVGRARLLCDLRRAEAQLSSYRNELHQRIDAATAEVVNRYHSDPLLCLSLLPTEAGIPRHREAAG
jgi:hypothetical protein